MIEFSRPHLLLLLPPLVAYWWRLGRSTQGPSAQVSALRRRGSAALRLVIFVVLVFCLAGVRHKLPSDSLTVTFLLDQSLSTRRQQGFIQQYLDRALQARPLETQVAIVHFAGEAALELAATHKPFQPRSSQTLTRDESDIGGAIQYAAAAQPPGQSGRVVLLSDGRETRGQLLSAAQALYASGLELDTVPLPASQEPEALVEELRCPPGVRQKAPFDLVVTVFSTHEVSQARLNLQRQGQPAGQFKVELQAGRNVFLLPQRADESGVLRYQVQLSLERDGERSNNQASGITMVEGSSRIALIRSRGSQDRLGPQLRERGLTVDSLEPDQVPLDLGEWLAYQGVILDNVASTELDTQTLDSLATLVREAGLGLVMLGGPDSFAAGGYAKTALSEALPVDLKVKRNRITPPTAQIHVIDKSGSMSEKTRGTEHMALAREASIASLEILTPEDLFGVVGFDDAAKWIVTLQKVTNPKALAGRIATLRAGGGTDLYPALRQAVTSLQGSDLSSRHILVLSDGATAPANFEALVSEARKANIYLSTVAVGDGADLQFLSHIAKLGKGRAYQADSAHALPRIFARETMLTARAAFDERPARLVEIGSHPVIAGLKVTGIPALLGHNLVTPKGAPHRILLETDSQDPVLAIGRHGLGKTVAFTGDSGLRWSSPWSQRPDFSQMLLQAVRWSLPQSQQGALEVSAHLDPLQRLAVEARIAPELAPQGLVASLVGPDGTSQSLDLVQSAPDRYEVTSDFHGNGTFVLNLATPDGRVRATQPITLTRSKELAGVEVQRELLQKAAQMGGGIFEPGPQQLFRKPKRPRGGYQELQPWLLGLALLLLLLEVALRRLPLPRFSRSARPVLEDAPETSTVASVRQKLKRPERSRRAVQISSTTSASEAPKVSSQVEEAPQSTTLEGLRKVRQRGKKQP